MFAHSQNARALQNVPSNKKAIKKTVPKKIVDPENVHTNTRVFEIVNIFKICL